MHFCTAYRLPTAPATAGAFFEERLPGHGNRSTETIGATREAYCVLASSLKAVQPLPQIEPPLFLAGEDTIKLFARDHPIAETRDRGIGALTVFRPALSAIPLPSASRPILSPLQSQYPADPGSCSTCHKRMPQDPTAPQSRRRPPTMCMLLLE